MRWFYFLLYILPGIQLLSGQGCGDYDLIRNPENWRGDTAEFVFYPDRIELDASSAGTASLVMDHMPGMKAFFIRFSLDFPPSLTNQFQLDMRCSGESGEKREINLIVGETGNNDGVLVQVRENERLINEQKYWSGKYGEGADRSEWVLSLEDGFLLLSDPVSDQTEKLNLGFENESGIYIEKIEIQCRYTQTRRNRFYFHQMQMWTDDFPGWQEINAGDIFITEIMRGSSSIIPFVEINNAFSAEACVPGLVLKINGEYIDLPVLEFTPFSYVVLSPQQIEGFLAIPTLNSLLKLADDALLSLELWLHGNMIHKAEVLVAADESDHSYEMIDILQPCRLDNWTLSAHSGGSPGEENSVFGSLGKPLLDLNWNSPGEAEIGFPYLNPDSDQLLSLIETSEGVSATINTDRIGKILLSLDKGLSSENFYVDVQGTVSHCGGMIDYWDSTLLISVPVLPEEHEILITEVMYDPPAGCPEYIEISRMSESSVWMGDLFLQREANNPISVTLPWQISDDKVWIVTGDRDRFLDCFSETNPEQVVEEKLFILPNNGSVIRLMDRAGEVTLDEVHYESSWHHSGFNNQKGIALERNYLHPQKGEWRSGYPQFQFRSPGFLPVWKQEVKEDKEKEVLVFSASGIRPGSVSGEDQLEILWNGKGKNQQGFLSIEIYDTGGNKIDQLTNSLPVQGGETIFWRGEKTNGELLKEGLYLFWVYYFDNIGTKKIFKRTCVLSRQ